MMRFLKLQKANEVAAEAADHIKTAQYLEALGDHKLAYHYIGKAKAARLLATRLMSEV